MNIGKYISNKIKQFGQYLIQIQTEPQIKQKRDRDGQSYWQIYDPSVVSVHYGLASRDRYFTNQFLLIFPHKFFNLFIYLEYRKNYERVI